jgi:hypothetical protein
MLGLVEPATAEIAFWAAENTLLIALSALVTALHSVSHQVILELLVKGLLADRRVFTSLFWN